jgi:hypothetical protein
MQKPSPEAAASEGRQNVHFLDVRGRFKNRNGDHPDRRAALYFASDPDLGPGDKIGHPFARERTVTGFIDQTKSVEHRPGLVFYFRERVGFVVTRRPYCETVGVVVWGLFYERHHLLLAEHES